MIYLHLVNDLVPDCLNAKDENILLMFRVTHSKHFNYSCISMNMNECYPGHPKCYHDQDKCPYALNKITTICRNGKHLENCEYIECITKHKCPKSYCIPYGYICDGKWDCWDSSDEIKCQSRSCVNKYKCHNSLVCLPLVLTCDKKNDCPLEDDEHFCYFCLPNCFCLGFAILCKIANINTKEQSKSFYVFVFINLTNSVSFSPLLVHNASRLIQCNLIHINSFITLTWDVTSYLL